jgi:hypothetical protein
MPIDPLTFDDADWPRIRSLWLFVLALGAAAIVATAISAQTYLSMLGHGHSPWGILVWQLSCWSLWAIAAPVVVPQVIAVARRRRQPWRSALRLSALGVVCVALHLLIAAELSLLIQPYVPAITSSFREALRVQIEPLLPVDMLAYGMLVLAGWATHGALSTRRLELRKSQLEAELTRARLDALRLEIQPHFLFNTLNTIAALIRSKADRRALEMLIGLSQLMRDTLDGDRRQLVTLSDEIAFVERYVDLQRVRFGERLQITYRVDEACRETLVPSFLLQPLVENALRHGLARLARPCTIEVAVSRDGGVLHIVVGDDGVGLPANFGTSTHAGTGLRNMQSRLERLYGSTASVTVAPRAGGGTTALVVLPDAETDTAVSA